MHNHSDIKEGSGALSPPPASPTPWAPNPRRALAGRLSRMKRGEITPEGREKLRQAAIKNRPWRFSTGPTTPEGKAAVAENGRVRQKGPTSVRAARVEARAVRELTQAMR